jgi:pimeloyl-ACP methyl ester carboxylesterase
MLADVQRRQIALPGRGVEIAVIDWGGEGPLALLHHANGFCAALWGLVAERLRHRFRLVAMDARGHGDSSCPEGPAAFRWSSLADDLAQVAEILLSESGRERIALGLGHSFGGTLTLAVAARNPELYQRVLLVDPVIVPQGPRFPEAHRRADEMAKRARKRRQRWGSRARARDYFAGRELFARWDPRALDLYVAEGLRERPDGQVELKCHGQVEGAIFDGDQGMDIFQEAARLRIPARLLWARLGSFPRALFQELVAQMQAGSIEDAEAGHLAPMESPELVAEAAIRFADGS